jgi:PAS domain S-box-containing protein
VGQKNPSKNELLSQIAQLKGQVAALREHLAERSGEAGPVYGQIAGSLREVLWAVDLNFRFTYVSASVKDLLGFTVEEAIGSDALESLVPESRDQVREYFQVLLPQETEHPDPDERLRLELEQICKDGSRLWVEIEPRFLRDENQVPIGIVGVSREITHRKKAELELEQYRDKLEELVEQRAIELADSEKRYRLVAEHTTDTIWTTDMELNLTFVSPSVELLRGYTVEQTMAQRIDEVFSEDSIQRAQKLLAEELSREGTQERYRTRERQIEMEVSRREGATVWVEMNVTFLRDEYDKAIGLLASSRDITERRISHQAQVNQLALIEAATDFIGLASLDGKVTFLNSAGRKMVGLETDQQIATTRIQDYTPNPDNLTKKIIPAVQKQGIWTGEGNLRNFKTGQMIDVQISTFLLRTSPKAPPRAMATVMRDITDRNRVARALARERSAFRIIAEASLRTESTEELCRRVLKGLSETLDFELGSVRIYRKSDRMLLPTVTIGLDEQIAAGQIKLVSLDDPLNFAAYTGRTGKPIFAPDVNIHPIAASHSARIRELKLKTLVSWPITNPNGELAAVLQLGTRSPILLSDSDRTFFATVAELFGLALQRRKAEEALVESEQKYRSLVETASDCIYIVQDGTVKYANPQLTDLLGVTAEKLQGSSYERFISSEQIERIEQLYARHIAGEKDLGIIEVVLVAENGKKIDVEMNASMVPFEGRDATMVIVRDVTDRKAAQVALGQSEQRYRLLAENSSDAIWMLGLDGKFIYISPAVEKLTGYTPVEVMAMPFERFLDLETVEGIHKKVAKELGRDSNDRTPSGVLEFRQRTKDGRLIDIEVMVTWFLDDSGNPIALQGSTRDITQKKMAERALQRAKDELEERVLQRTSDLERSNQKLIRQIDQRKKAQADLAIGEARYRTLFESAPDGVFIVGRDSRIQDCNAMFCKMSGFTKEELVGVRPIDLVSAGSRFDESRFVGQLDRTGMSEDEVELICKDGHRFPMWSKATMIKDPRGRFVHTIVHCRDITTRRRMETDLAAKASEVELYNDILTHDLNNINQTTLTYINMLLSGDFGDLNPDQDRFLGTCQRQIDRCTSLIEKIKTLSELRTSPSGPLTSINVGKVIEKVIETLQETYSGREVKIEFEYSNGKMASADQLIRQLFHNLFENALKHAGTDRVEIRVRMELVERDGRSFVEVAVEDNGPGVRDEQKLSIFGRFECSRPHKGSGLGLAIVRALAERYHGSVWVEDRVPGDQTAGARFMVRLPFAG